ncbi:MAG: hypothetical protein HDS42_04190, partial [Bacteroides sp.]|nr:hypothetical protein [Bacteroides sp.]
MANESYIYQITTSDGKVHEVNKAYIDKYGMDAYAREYKGATVRMRDKEGADYAIPLVHYDKAVAQGLHIFTIDATPSAAAPKTPAQAQTAAQSSQTVQAGKAQQAGKAAQAQTAEDTPQVTPPDKVPSGDKPAWLLNAMAAKEVAKAYDLAASIGEQRERNKRVMGSMTQKGRDRVKAGRTLAGMAGTPTRVLGLASPGGSDESSSLGSDHDTATKKTMLVGSPKPYGVKLVDGKVKTVWQLTDGSLTTDLGEADKAENVARKARMAHEHEKAVRNIVPDVVDGLWEEALSKDRLDDEAYIEKREKDSKSIGGFLSAFAEASMDPVRKHSSISEIEREKTRRETFDLDRLTESAYKRIPDDLRREVIGGYEEYFRKNPGELKGRNVSKAAEDALRGDIYREFYERVVASQMPKSTEEFVMRKALDQPLLTGEAKLAGATLARSHGLDIAETEAMERYGSGHKVASGVGTVLNIAFDPTMMATGAFGGAVSKGVMNTAGKAMAKGMAGKVLSRPLAGRMLEHVTAGGVGFMGFEMAKDVQGQLRHGGVVNPETGKSEGYSMESVLNSGVRGLAMGAATGAVAPLVGNVADGLVKGTTSTAGKLALRGGQAAVSKFFEGTIFAAPEIYEFRTMGNDDFDRLYAKRFGYDQETDATKRDEARKKARNSLSWDCFVENEAMMVGFGATGAVKSAPRVIAGLRRHDPAKLGRPLTREERIDNNRSFMERLGRQLDGMPGGMFLTKEEQQELRDKGYGKLSELFRYDPVNGGRRNRTPGRTPAGESSTSGKSSSLGSDHDVKGIHGIFREEQRTDERSRDFDGYDAMERVMGDDNVSEAVRAKLYYLLTGRAVMPSSVMGYDTVDNHDGTVTINARNSRGGIVVSRRVRYKDRGKSDDLQVAEHWSAVPEVRREINKVERQIELNTIDILEQYATRAVGLVVMDDVKGAVGRRHNLPEQAVENIYMKHFNGEALSEAEMAIVEDVNSFMEEGYGKYGSLTPEGLRQRVKEDTGVDVDAALRKGKYERSMKEDVALHEYGSLLSQEADRHRKAYSTYREESREMREEDMENFRRANRMQRDGRLIEGPEPEPGREYEESSLGPEPGRQYEDADRMAEHDALWGRLYEAGVGIHDAFGAEAEECLARLYDDPMDVLSDPSLSDDMRGAALEYVNAVNAYRGFVDAADDAVEAKRRQVEETVNRRTHRDSGMIVPATLKGGKDVYVVGGTVRMFDDGSGVDVAGSSRTVVVMDEGGQCRVVAPELFESVEAGIDPQTELQAAYDAIEREHNAMFGENAESLAEPEAQAQDQTAAQPEDNNGTENIPEEQEKESSLLSDHDVPEAQGFAENAESVPNSSVSVENVQETKAEGATTNYLREYTNKKSGKTIKIRPDISDPDKDGVVKVKFVGDVYDKEGNFIHQASFQHIIIAQEDIYKIEGLEGLDIYNEDGSFSATELRIAPSGEIGAYDREGVKIWLKRNPITGEEGKLPSFEKEISTALSRIPVDEETGEPVFEAVDKETAWDGLVEDSADEAEALQYAESMVKELEKDVKKAQEKLDNVPFSRNRPKFKAAKEKARKGLEEARKSLAHWQGMLDVHRSRQAQTRTPAEEISSDGKTIQPTETASPIDK